MDLNSLSAAIFNGVLKNKPPADLIKEAYTYIQKPILSFDTSFRLYGYAFPHPNSYRPWEDISQHGFLPDTFIYGQKSLSYQEVLYENGSSVYLDYGLTKEYPQVCSPIMHGGRLLGYVGIGVEESPDIESLIKANDMLASALGLIISKSEGNAAAASFDAGTLLNSLELTPEQAAYLKSAANPPYLFAVMSSEKSDAPTLEYVKHRIEGECPAVMGSTAQKKRLSLLFYGKEVYEEPGPIIPLFDKYTKRYSLKCGVSDWFTDPVRLPQAKMQAELASDLINGSSKEGCTALFREKFYGIIALSAIERYGGKISLPPGFLKLADDDKNRSDLLRTLDACLLYGGNSTLAAKEMGLHKNTVYYREGKLRELLGDALFGPDNYLKNTLGVLMLESGRL